MSIDVMRLVWKHAPFKGGPLLVLLAMADWADDDGGSIFPKVETLAKKARLSVRGAQLALRELEDATVIEKVKEATGRPGRATEYRIVLERVKEVRPCPTGANLGGDGCSLQHEGVQSDAGRVQNATPHIDNHHSNHHENHHGEPPAATPAGGGGQDLFGSSPPAVASPAQILDAAYAAYDEAAARQGWGKIGKRTDARDKALRARLKDVGGLDGWKVALEKAEASDFLCGRAPPRAGKPPFRADLDFLIRESKFVFLMEGKYDNRNGPSPHDDNNSVAIAARVAARRAASRGHGQALD